MRNSFKCILYIELNNFQNTSEWIILSFLSTQKQRQKKSKVQKSLTIEPVVLWNVSSDVMVVMSRPQGPRERSILAKEIRSCSRVEVLICKGGKNTQDFKSLPADTADNRPISRHETQDVYCIHQNILFCKFPLQILKNLLSWRKNNSINFGKLITNTWI